MKPHLAFPFCLTVLGLLLAQSVQAQSPLDCFDPNSTGANDPNFPYFDQNSDCMYDPNDGDVELTREDFATGRIDGNKIGDGSLGSLVIPAVIDGTNVHTIKGLKISSMLNVNIHSDLITSTGTLSIRCFGTVSIAPGLMANAAFGNLKIQANSLRAADAFLLAYKKVDVRLSDLAYLDGVFMISQTRDIRLRAQSVVP